MFTSNFIPRLRYEVEGSQRDHKGRPPLIRGAQSSQSVLLFSWLEVAQSLYLGRTNLCA